MQLSVLIIIMHAIETTHPSQVLDITPIFLKDRTWRMKMQMRERTKSISLFFCPQETCGTNKYCKVLAFFLSPEQKYIHSQ